MKMKQGGGVKVKVKVKVVDRGRWKGVRLTGSIEWSKEGVERELLLKGLGLTGKCIWEF